MLTDPMLEENQGTFCINIDKDEYDKEYLPLILYKDCVRENYDRR